MAGKFCMGGSEIEMGKIYCSTESPDAQGWEWVEQQLLKVRSQLTRYLTDTVGACFLWRPSDNSLAS